MQCIYTAGVDDDDFRNLVGDYLNTTNPAMADVVLELEPGHRGFGIDHAVKHHGVSEQEIREVLFEYPAPEKKRSRHDRSPSRTLYWGANRNGRELTIAVIEYEHNGRLHLVLITAFPETEEEWRTRT